jgi:hypothetical protein
MAEARTVLALVHDDGHVGLLSNTKSTDAEVAGYARLLNALSITGWRTERLESRAAIRANLARAGCTVCEITYSCGCTAGPVLDGRCPHGTRDQVHRLAHQTGFCSNTSSRHWGPPILTEEA